MQLRVEPERVAELAAAVARARAEGLAVARSPDLLRGTLTAMSAGDGGLAGAAVRFVDAWGQSLEDAVRELGWLADGLQAAAQLYAAVERAGKVRAPLGQPGLGLSLGPGLGARP